VAQALRLPLQRVSVETALEEDLMGRLLYDETLPDLVVTLWYMPSEGAANQPSNLRDEFLRQYEESGSPLQAAPTSSRILVVEDLDEPPPSQQEPSSIPEDTERRHDNEETKRAINEEALQAKVAALEEEVERIKHQERLRAEMEKEKTNEESGAGSIGDTVRELSRSQDREELKELLAQRDLVRGARMEANDLILERERQKQLKIERDVSMMRELDAAAAGHKNGIVNIQLAPRPQERRDFEAEIRENPRHIARQHAWLQPLLQRSATPPSDMRPADASGATREESDYWM